MCIFMFALQTFMASFSFSDSKVVFFYLLIFEHQLLQVSKPGSVKVEKLMNIERYSHVMHISSTVRPLFLSYKMDEWLYLFIGLIQLRLIIKHSIWILIEQIPVHNCQLMFMAYLYETCAICMPWLFSSFASMLHQSALLC